MAAKRLGVDVGPVSSTAVLVQHGVAAVQVAGGSPLLASGVLFDEDDVPSCGRDAVAAGRAAPVRFVADPVAAVSAADPRGARALAALLAHVATGAGDVDEVSVVVPPTWGPRRQTLVRDAAAEAGAGPLRLVAHPVAVAARLATFDGSVAVGHVLVVDTDRGMVSVVRGAGPGWEVAAMQERADAGITGAVGQVCAAVGGDLQTGSARSGQSERDAVVLAGRVHAVLDVLRSAGEAAVVLASGGAAVLTRDRCGLIVQPLCTQVVEAAVTAVDAADIDTTDITGIAVTGGTWYADLVAAELRERFVLSPTVFMPGDAAAAHGAVGGVLDVGDPVVSLRDVPRPGVRTLLAVMVPAVASWVLLPHALTRGNELMPYHPYDTRFPQAFDLLFNRAEFVLTGLFIAMAAVACGQYVAAAVHADTAARGEPGSRARLCGRALAATAGFGFALAGLYGLLGGAILTQVPTQRFLLWALVGAVAPVAIAGLAGLVTPFAVGLHRVAWPDRLRPPVLPVIFVTVGVLLADVSDGFRRWLFFAHPHVLSTLHDALGGPVGAGLICAAAAITIVSRRSTRIAFGVLAGLAGAVTYSFHNLYAVETIFVVATGGWWVLRGARLALDALPMDTVRAWWRDLVTTPATPAGQE